MKITTWANVKSMGGQQRWGLRKDELREDGSSYSAFPRSWQEAVGSGRQTERQGTSDRHVQRMSSGEEIWQRRQRPGVQGEKRQTESDGCYTDRIKTEQTEPAHIHAHTTAAQCIKFLLTQHNKVRYNIYVVLLLIDIFYYIFDFHIICTIDEHDCLKLNIWEI